MHNVNIFVVVGTVAGIVLALVVVIDVVFLVARVAVRVLLAVSVMVVLLAEVVVRFLLPIVAVVVVMVVQTWTSLCASFARYLASCSFQHPPQAKSTETSFTPRPPSHPLPGLQRLHRGRRRPAHFRLVSAQGPEATAFEGELLRAPAPHTTSGRGGSLDRHVRGGLCNTTLGLQDRGVRSGAGGERMGVPYSEGLLVAA